MKFSAIVLVVSAFLVSQSAAALIAKRQSCTCGGGWDNYRFRPYVLTAGADNSYDSSDIEDAINAAEDGGAR